MHHKLIVIGEPEILSLVGTRNNALNEILSNYIDFNDQGVIYFSSTVSMACEDYYCDDVRYVGIPVYSKSSRIILNKKNEIIKIFKELLDLSSGYKVHVQFRLPSIFTLQMYFILKDLIPKNSISFYIAGNWNESLRYNHPDKYWYLKYLIKVQNIIIKNKTCVFTGNKLLAENNHLTKDSIAFYSTTHTGSDIKPYCNKYDFNEVCFIGRIEKLKNYDFIVELAKQKQGKRYIFNILGDGPEMNDLLGLIEKFKLNNIKVHGHISNRSEFDSIINRCKYFILPSYTEGTSKTLPEMMCRSTLPIAFSNVGSNNEILSFNNGFLAPIDDVMAVLKYMQDMDSNYDKYEIMVNNGLQYAKNNTLKKQLNNMFNFIYKV
ncbi:TPA: glycosyltransferase [Photobacterium damselae]